jgi:hypothetical protein
MDLIKQNKNYIGLLMNSFRKSSRLILGCFGGTSLDVYLNGKNTYPSGNTRVYSLYFNLDFDFNDYPVWDIVYFAQGNTIYFGYDLSKPLRLVKSEDTFPHYPKDFNQLYNYIRWGDSVSFNDIFKGMKGSHGFEYTIEDLRSDRELLYQTDEYKYIQSTTEDVSKKASVMAKLVDSAFPRLKRRDVLPFAWIDTGKGTFNFSTRSWAKSYTKGIEKTPLNTFSSSRSVFTSSYISAMLSLLEFEINLNGSFNGCIAAGTTYSQWASSAFNFKK